MREAAESGRSQADDLLRILELITAAPPDWHGVMRAMVHRAVLVTFVNPLSVATARQRQGFIDELASFDLIHADSILVARLAGMLRGEPIARRSFDGNS